MFHIRVKSSTVVLVFGYMHLPWSGSRRGFLSEAVRDEDDGEREEKERPADEAARPGHALRKEVVQEGDGGDPDGGGHGLAEEEDAPGLAKVARLDPIEEVNLRERRDPSQGRQKTSRH